MKNEILTNENKGFSLVELIVVIAIMAVMTSVLAPSLLGYVEQSRMAKDNSAMGEVNNAIKLALANQDVYDECLAYNVTNNFSCYADVAAYATAGDKVVDKAADATKGTAEYWHWNDNARLLDEVAYFADGYMRGMTITFTATNNANEAVCQLANARINDMGSKKATNADATGGLDYKYDNDCDGATGMTLQKMTSAGGVGDVTSPRTGKLYNNLRAVIGDTITLSSQTYRNSEYTVFIRMGSMGGNNASSMDAVAVYGQWNGTNL